MAGINLTPLKPVEWPIAWKHGDKLVPVINGSETKLCCVYAAAPHPHFEALTRLGFSGKLAQRLRLIRGRMIPTTDIPGNRVHLFWAAWFANAGEARLVENAAHKLLDRHRIVSGPNHSEWFTVRPEWAKQAILVAADKVGVNVIPHERYVKLCQWRSSLPLDRRIPRTKKEFDAYRQRVAAIAKLAIKVGASLHGDTHC